VILTTAADWRGRWFSRATFAGDIGPGARDRDGSGHMKRMAGLVAGLTLFLGGQALAEDANPVGANKNWGAEVTTPAVNQTGVLKGPLDDAQKALIAKVDAYFNALIDLRGTFQQTDVEQKQDRGKFYISRPGKIRFEFGAPTQMVIMSDGYLLSFEDNALGKADRYPLESTPFRILLAEKVDVLRDAQLADLYEDQDLVAVTLLDKSPDNQGNGQIKLFFTKAGESMELKEWVITGQDGDTRVEIANLVRDEKPDPKLFVNTPFDQLKNKTNQ
jgi:outer membrane lipoprotein-sorting protein